MNPSNSIPRLFSVVALMLACNSFAAEQIPRATETDDAIVVRIGQQPVLQYNKSITKLPPGIEAVYARSGYIHPIYSPSGMVVTGHYAADHPHQTGLFSAWVNATFRGHPVDFWNAKKGLGRVAHEKVLFVRNHDDRAEFSVQLIHEDTSQPDSPVIVLRETWNVTVHKPSTSGNIIDIVSTQACATEDPLTINDYHYGGMAVRGCDPWYSDTAAAAVKAYTKGLASNPEIAPPGIDVMNHSFLTDESKSRFDGNHTRPNWVDLHGLTDGNMAGIAILNSDQNFRSPQPVRLNPSKPYFCFAPCVLGSFEIKPSEDLVSKYRLVVHDGPPNTKQLDEQWNKLNTGNR